ncbi:MAG: hypothetical protein M1817_006002 [Caeruleum heppii]|nr:MAG: hypothetical protein M1817_006002 [Caeruleum heppii]
MLAPRAGPIVAESQRDYDSILIRSLIFLVPGLDLLLLLAHQSRKACELKDNQDVQRRILGVMRVWMDNKHAEAAAWDDDLFDSIMLNGMNAGESLVGLCHRLQLDRRSAQTNQAHELRRTQTASRGITMTKQLRSASSLLNIHALDPMNILTLNEKILAQYLAAVDLVLFRAATDSDQVEHWIQHSRSDAALEHHRCPVQQTQLFEERAAVIKHWVQVVILVSRTPGSRANAYKMFVRVVKLLISYGDLEGASVTLGALVSDRLSRSSFPITWHALEAEGLTGQLRNVQYMLNDKYEATLSSLADPVIPLFTGHRGLLHKVARQFGRPDIFDLKALATNSEELTTRVPASQALGYKYEVSVHGVGPLLDLSKYIRMWGDIDAARVRVRAGHAFGTVGQAAFVSQLYGLEMNKRNDVDEVNHDLEVVSEMIESSMLRSFTLTMNNTNPDDAQRQAVLEALCKSAMTDEAGWI